MSEIFYIGFDGGGSQSRYILQSGDAQPLQFAIQESVKYSDIGIDLAAKTFASHIAKHLPKNAAQLYITMSLSGASDSSERDQFVLALQNSLVGHTASIQLTGDSAFAFRAAYPEGESGIVVICGTGSVVVARDVNGEMIQRGGWGRLLGDEGSGYWIGLQALKHYARASDGLEEKAELYESIESAINELCNGDRIALRRMLYTNELRPQDFAPLVFDAGAQDETARSITIDGALSLAQYIRVLAEAEEVEIEPILTLHGSILGNRLFREIFIENINDIGFDMHELTSDDILRYALEQARTADRTE